MTPSHAPRVDHWPEAMRSAALLSGTLVRCGPGVRPVGWPETPMTRAVAVAQHLTPHTAASGESAAWIWGACRSPGTPLTLIMRRGRVPLHVADPRVRVHEYKLEPDELFSLGPYAVTTRLRTAYDLLRAPDEFTLTRHIACRLLLARTLQPVEKIGGRADRSSKADRARVTQRLKKVYGY